MANSLNFLQASKKSRGKARKKAGTRARHAARAAEEQQLLLLMAGRRTVGNVVFTGIVVNRFKFDGWILPSDPAKLPKLVQARMAEMVAEAIATGSAGKTVGGTPPRGVLYLRLSDVKEGVRVGEGLRVKFKVYVDDEGAGAYDVGLA